MPSSRGLQGIISLFGFRGLATSPTAKSDTESGVGVDGAEVVGQQITDTDQGAGVDGSEVAAPSVPGTDLGVGVDGEEAISATIADADAGTGADVKVTADTGLKSTAVDAGVGAETESISATLEDTDLGVGVDTETLATDRDLEVCITSIEGDLTVDLDITSEECA